MSNKYQIIVKKIKPESDEEQVLSKMTKMFNISEEKAKKMLEKPRIIKKNLDEISAKEIVDKLINIGLDAIIKKMPETHLEGEVAQPVIQKKIEVNNHFTTKSPDQQPKKNQRNSTSQKSNVNEKDEGRVAALFKIEEIGVLPIASILGGIICAILSAAFWIFSFWILGKQYAVVAIATAISGSIGVVKLGGRGVISGIFCIFLAIASLGNRLYGQTHLIYKDAMSKTALTMYDNKRKEIQGYSTTMSDVEFIKYVKKLTDYDITPAEKNNKDIMREFRTITETKLADFEAMTYDDWHNKIYSKVSKDFEKSFSFWDLFKKILGFNLIVAVIISLVIAFGIGNGGKEKLS